MINAAEEKQLRLETHLSVFLQPVSGGRTVRTDMEKCPISFIYISGRLVHVKNEQHCFLFNL